MSRDSREFEVELVVTTTYSVSLTARTPEEAESIAEAMFEDGDILPVVATFVESCEAIAIEDLVELDEDEEFEEEELDDTSDD